MELLSDDDRDKRHDKERIAHEILDECDYYNVGAGPEGPWPFKSLTVTRIYNTVYVYDVDGQAVDVFGIEEILDDERDDIYQNLIEKLEAYHEQSLDEL
jgi:hypothetical protein